MNERHSAVFDFPAYGQIAVVVDGKQVVALSLSGDIQALNKKYFATDSAPTSEARRLLEACRKQIGEYFDGRRKSFSLPLANPAGSAFSVRVMRELECVEWGAFVTYSELAQKAGHPKAARAVGSIMSANPLPLLRPCHRVFAKNGLGGFSAGRRTKQKLLALEGHSL